MIKVCKRIKWMGGVKVLCVVHLARFPDVYKTLSLTRDSCEVCTAMEVKPRLRMYVWTFGSGPDTVRGCKVLCEDCGPNYIAGYAGTDVKKRETFNANYLCKVCERGPGATNPAPE